MFLPLQNALKRLLKEASLGTGLFREQVFGLYPYMFEPHQLVRLCHCLDEVRDVPGTFVEAGCAYGRTTAFLNRYMDHLGLDRPYVAIDTFAGFVADDAAFEIAERGKPASLKRAFRDNDQRWVDEGLRIERVRRVRTVRADVARFDFRSLAPIAFALIDVDVYKPIKAILPVIHDLAAPGGLIVVDNCRGGNDFDGALQAYNEFTAERGLPPEIVCDKLGLIRKPRSGAASVDALGREQEVGPVRKSA